MCFAVGAALLRERVSSPLGLLGLFVLFPCTFFGANFGAGAPTIIAIHLDDPSSAIVVLASILSIAMAACLVRAAGSFLPAATTTRERAIRPMPETGSVLTVG
jgi:hypothetical protein